MAFGIKREELTLWKQKVASGEVALITHFWHDPRFPQYKTVTKAGCSDLDKLKRWGEKYGLKAKWIDRRSPYPHYDLMGETQIKVLLAEGQSEDLKRFRLEDHDD
ncbi:hypothetical protein [Tuberibacillus calidus]|jgi:hypothetical protein|uniref:hypothetical protein n=1 Tax=Tuberibacillus calidus TaxID=340097 RepID=UPI0004150A39|nr:hypothetical protein [Tuberibacillus calidus]